MSRMATSEREWSADTTLIGNVFHDENCCARFSRPRVGLALFFLSYLTAPALFSFKW